ncbi:MAG: L-histidine N(alpha)-methyltransferase [Alphaproteobacteria bacterium]|nr:L-histidine N(alpha)-methyltransferase [Alphaproteobacteria bacterium]MDE2111624.1 L-histidine N(alpha)-methyltransferase [Alphaproteobacteria bacterium]MDE2494232.1 L-histidine N(alpha)-methyltransferase [Alphaproteobacteria bacterium]
MSGLRLPAGAASLPVQYRSEFAAALLSGLSARPRSIPCKFFYDRYGSVLFEWICTLPEYYPTRTETALLRDRSGEIARAVGPDATLIEFGAGAPWKAEVVLDALERPRGYVPIDISGEHLRAMTEQLKRKRPELPVEPVVADFNKPFSLPAICEGSRRVGFFPGSTIGNLDRQEAISFLRRAALLLQGGGLLIGVDLVKKPAILHAAYNDSAGVTEAFNKNILARANRELGADFHLDRFGHYAFYNPAEQRIEMHLVSLADQKVSVCGHSFAFAEGEAIHTENSHKYTLDGVRTLAEESGFRAPSVWCDPDRLFSVHWLEPKAPA